MLVWLTPHSRRTLLAEGGRDVVHVLDMSWWSSVRSWCVLMCSIVDRYRCCKITLMLSVLISKPIQETPRLSFDFCPDLFTDLFISFIAFFILPRVEENFQTVTVKWCSTSCRFTCLWASESPSQAGKQKTKTSWHFESLCFLSNPPTHSDKHMKSDSCCRWRRRFPFICNYTSQMCGAVVPLKVTASCVRNGCDDAANEKGKKSIMMGYRTASMLPRRPFNTQQCWVSLIV